MAVKLLRAMALLALAMVACASGPAVAQDYPSHPIKLLVGFPPGGGVDTSARVVAQEMSKLLGQSIVIENKPGAAGTLAAAETARSTPDGYTLLVTPGGHALFGAIFKSLPFNTVTSFDWISTITTIPFFVIVPAESEFKTLPDLIAKAKMSPGAATFGSAGPGSTHHLGLEFLAIRTGVKFLHVPYRGEAPLIAGLMGQQIAFSLATPTLAIANVKAGKLRALAVTSNTRAAELPDVPTVEQALGIADFDVRSWFALAGPAGMPTVVTARLNAELRNAIAIPAVRARLAAIGGEPTATSPEAMRERVTRELAMWTKAVEAAGIPKQ
jgi:tripartite-type tricarboxylate transporter receptor subunit TctC